MKTYIQIGAGGTGTHLIAPMLAYLESYHRNYQPPVTFDPHAAIPIPPPAEVDREWQYVIIDGDAYDTGNLERQIFDPTFVASNKADAMAAMYNRYPVRSVPRFIGREDLQTMFNDGDTVLICADNHSIRALVQERALELPNAVVINAGNEYHDGNVQLFVRAENENKTPPITFLHPEIRYLGEEDRQPMSCQQVAELPGGGQLILANMAAAQGMLTAMWRLHEGLWTDGWTEWQFDLRAGTTHAIDMRPRRGWTR